MPECKDTSCPLVPRIEALERDSEHNKEAHKDFYARLENSHTAVAVIDSKLLQIKEDTEEIKTSVQKLQESSSGTQDLKKDVEELKSKPGKRWDGIVDKVIFTLIGVGITYLASKWGLV